MGPSKSSHLTFFGSWIRIKRFLIPQDLRDFVCKSCFISEIDRPGWLSGQYIDLRQSASFFFDRPERKKSKPAQMGISQVLHALGMKFEGREHSGMDDTRNIARIAMELAKKGWVLEKNRSLPENGGKERRFEWMGKKRGEIREEVVLQLEGLNNAQKQLPVKVEA